MQVISEIGGCRAKPCLFKMPEKEPLHARCDRTGMEGLLSRSVVVVVADAYFSEA